MEIWTVMKARHAVRSFTDQRIEGEAVAALRQAAEECNAESGLHIQLVLDEPAAFVGRPAHYGRIENCKNYIALIGPKAAEEACGYYGERLVLLAQEWGINSCWVALTYSRNKTAVQLQRGEKLHLVIALGYGTTQGTAHRSKDRAQLCRVEDGSGGEGGDMPDWFKAGMEAAMLAPTALNQQRFLFTLSGDSVRAKALPGPYTKVDLGIVKYHFEQGAAAAGRTLEMRP